jgi:multidrug resistance efflux pump
VQDRSLSPIPTPPAQRWREFRLIYLPRACFVAGVVLAAVLWSRWVAPATTVAEAQLTQTEVRAPHAGVVAGMEVGLLQTVSAGQVVGQLAVANTRLLEATLAVIRAEVGMLSATSQGLTDRQRVAIEWERLQLESMSHRVELAGLKVKVQQADEEIARTRPLREAGLVTEESFSQLNTNRAALSAQVTELNRLVSHFEVLLRRHAPPASQSAALSGESAMVAALNVQDSKLKLAEAQLAPRPLVSPLAGVVTQVLRRPGEAVAAGEPILRIEATRSERLVFYLRQPLVVEPKPGMMAQVSTRSEPRVVASAKIMEVGAVMEPLPPTLHAAMRLPTITGPELGLRVQLSVPDSLVLRPGELVDVAIQ